MVCQTRSGSAPERCGLVGAWCRPGSAEDVATQQNAALVEQAAAKASSLKQPAQSLAQAVPQFKLD